MTELTTVLTPDQVVVRPETLEGLSRDQTHVLEAGRPLAAAFPKSAAEVSATLSLASKLRIPVVPRGAGSGLAGGANAVDGCLILSTVRMDRIVEIDSDDLVAVVQPGVMNARLAVEVTKQGLLFAPDPSSFEISSIGGNLATNAGGLRCVKYGVTREATLGLEVVLADGTILRTGRRTVKGVAGYDLVGLFVGSEGTLGVISEATLRLPPRPLRPARSSPRSPPWPTPLRRWRASRSKSMNVRASTSDIRRFEPSAPRPWVVRGLRNPQLCGVGYLRVAIAVQVATRSGSTTISGRSSSRIER